MKFDVVMPTLNSVSRIGEKIFRRVLKEIYLQIPVNRLLVIDDGSKDGTIKIVKEFNAVVVNGVGSLGKAREIGIRSVKTEWFYFIDDDNLVPSRFNEKMWKYVDNQAGMVFAKAIIPYNNYIVRYETFINKFRRFIGLRDVVERRGYTGATLLRTQAVKGIRIPAVPRQEDHYIKRYCEQQNWRVKYASNIIVLHLHRDLPSYRTQYLEGYGMAVVKAISKERMLASWLLTYPKSVLALPYVRNVNLLRNVPRTYYIKYKGYVDAQKRNLTHPCNGGKTVASLNIGCGGTKKYPFKDLGCEVNCDIQKPEFKINNFVCCDACYVPFKEYAFSSIFAYHLIEHLKSPSLFLKECSRVGNGVLHIITPNLYSENSFRDKSHIQHFTVFTLEALLKQFFDDIKIWGQEGFWVKLRGNNFIFRITEPFSSKFVFLANNIYAICKKSKIGLGPLKPSQSNNHQQLV